MDEVITIGKAVLSGGSQAATVGLLTVLAVPKLRKKVFGNGDDQRFDAIDGAIDKLGSNHMDHLEQAVNKNTEAINSMREKVIEKMVDLQEDENKILTDIRVAVEKRN